MTLYGNEKTHNSQDMYVGDTNDTYVSLYGGYYDGITEPNPEDVTGNTINILDTMNIVDGWVVYENPKQVGSENGYAELNIHDNNDTHNLHVNVIAPMVEYGRGNYDAYLDGGTHGKGTNQYIGGGIVFRNTMSDGKFYEGSFRAGRVKSDYTSNDFSTGRRPVSESFRTSSAYFGGHLGVGRDLKLSRNDPYPDRFVYYSKLFYTRTAADDVTLATGELYHLDAVDSLRLRLGAKYIYNVNEIHKFYLGMAWEHEFDGSSHAEYKGLRTDTPSIRGDSGMVEIGWNYEPKGDNRFSVDLSAIGWFGRQRGISGRLGINWLF